MFKLNYFNAVRKESGQVIKWCNYFVCKHRRLNLHLLILEEVIKSFYDEGFKDFYNKWKDIPGRELDYLLENYELNKIDKVTQVQK